MTTQSGSAARRIHPRWLVLLPVQAALMVGLGLLVTGPMAGHWPLSAEDGLNRAFAAHRTPLGNEVTEWLSLAASTQWVVAMTVICVAGLLLLSRATLWREACFLGASVAVQSAVFLVVTICVERPRPHVHHLDAAPPTSSFPSGHVGASLALYGGLATLAFTRLRGPWRHVAAVLLLLIPPAVAVSRMYRGMHHPSDVAAGLLNAACTLFVIGRTVLGTERDVRRSSVPLARRGPGDPDAESAQDADAGLTGLRAVVVRHPNACGDQLAARIRGILDRHGYTDQWWTETSEEHPGGGPEALKEAATADLVVVCGGDGTVRACAVGTAGTGVPMAIVPCGTGNLLARNLGLPTDAATALDRALAGEATSIDVGRVHGDGLDETGFTVMAGAGFDAAMVRDASEDLKSRIGWAAYALSGARHLRDPRMRLSIQLDGGPVLERRARMVVIGNVGALQGGLPLLPDARPDDGRLDVVLLDPRGPVGWLATAGHFATRMLPGRPRPTVTDTRGGRPAARGALEYFTAASVDLRFATPQPRELDGDSAGNGVRLAVEVRPGALRIQLPGPPAQAAHRPRTADRALTTGG